MFEFLEGFEKRMEFVAVVESIVNRKYRNMEIENWFEENELDNLFFSLLVYIMEQTLSENDECTLGNITRFLDDILKTYNKNMSFDQVANLSEYMVKDILQNKGQIKTYGTMNYYDKWNATKIRLISDKITEDNKIIYQLTDQGYDFLFRTKEVDRELDFKLEQLKLKELLKRKNYKHALKQSRDLIAMLRQKKRELEEFIYRVRQNIHEVDKVQYEKLISETYNLIDEEYKGMQELKDEVVKDEERINKEVIDNGYSDDSLKKALMSLGEIKRNLQLVIREQRNLIAKRFNMNDIYEETIRNSFYTSIVKRFDFEKEILIPLENITEIDIPKLVNLVRPLYHPNLCKQLNLSLIYQEQGKLREIDGEESSLEEELLEEDKTIENRRLENEINYRIVERIFKYADKVKKEFCFSEFYQNIVDKTKRLTDYTENKRIFVIMLKLYEYGTIDIADWKEQSLNEMIPEANGEFDLSWCLQRIEQNQPSFFDVNKISIEKGDKIFRAVIEEYDNQEGLRSVVEMDDLLFIPEIREVRQNA